MNDARESGLRISWASSAGQRIHAEAASEATYCTVPVYLKKRESSGFGCGALYCLSMKKRESVHPALYSHYPWQVIIALRPIALDINIEMSI